MTFFNSKALCKHVFMTQFLYFNRSFEYSENKIKEHTTDYYIPDHTMLLSLLRRHLIQT